MAVAVVAVEAEVAVEAVVVDAEAAVVVEAAAAATVVAGAAMPPNGSTSAMSRAAVNRVRVGLGK